MVYREPVLDMQLIQERIAGAAMELSRQPVRSAGGIRNCSRVGEMGKLNRSISLLRNIFCANRFATPGTAGQVK